MKTSSAANCTDERTIRERISLNVKLSFVRGDLCSSVAVSDFDVELIVLLGSQVSDGSIIHH